jgi:hypothetical protein
VNALRAEFTEIEHFLIETDRIAIDVCFRELDAQWQHLPGELAISARCATFVHGLEKTLIDLRDALSEDPDGRPSFPLQRAWDIVDRLEQGAERLFSCLSPDTMEAVPDEGAKRSKKAAKKAKKAAKKAKKAAKKAKKG